MRNFLSGFAQLVLGFAIAILLLVGGSVAATLYLVARLTALPPKPDFGEFSSEVVTRATSNPAAPLPNATKSPASTASPKPSPTASASPKPTPKPTPTGLYAAKVTWAEGLVLRKEPSYAADSVGGVAYEERVSVLEERDGGEWQKVRSSSGLEGWVVGGNLEKAEGEPTPPTTTETTTDSPPPSTDQLTDPQPTDNLETENEQTDLESENNAADSTEMNETNGELNNEINSEPN